jgi:hypothetical protein
MTPGGGPDVGLTVSVASTANSALDQRYLITQGDNVSGGAGVPKWLIPVGMILAAGVFIVWLIKR